MQLEEMRRIHCDDPLESLHPRHFVLAARGKWETKALHMANLSQLGRRPQGWLGSSYPQI